ncbi:MAG TPA: hypothetical protein VMD98_07710, partial [Bryocella sp.]|nr:hypothetical protein [Bryocella sp.]
MRRVARTLIALLVALIGLVCMAADTKPAAKQDSSTDPRLAGAFRRPAQNGWTYVHLTGTPSEIGFQHGYLLA